MPLSIPLPGMLTIVQVLPLRVSDSSVVPTVPTATHVLVAVQDTAVNCQVVPGPPGGGVGWSSQLAAAGWAITRTVDTTSAAVTANRFIAIVTPPEFSMVGAMGALPC